MQIAPDQIDPDAAKVVQRLRRYDHAAYLVGGCVRDLLLGLKPKDFDVVTSATPPEIKRLFRNCRIIGRRFRLAHIFFGSKIIETSTFRANPREIEEEENENGNGNGNGETENADLLIRRDNVFGTPEEDARRRDFTINGLFYDLETGHVIDHVNGLVDLEARVVRTIGDPDIRFREDPVRILRAVKFAARCNLTIEPETYRRMMEHRLEIEKCAQARVSEEFYRLLRAGAAKRSMEILVETDLLELLSPELSRGLKGDADSDDTRLRRARLWAYLEALDRSTTRRTTPPSNSLLLAVLMLPPLRDALDPDSNGVRDIGQMVAQGIAPALEHLKASRRDAELARQVLLAIRYILPSKQPRRKRPHLAGREFFDDALRLCEIISDAETLAPELGGRPIIAEGTDALAVAASDSDADTEELAPELEPLDGFERGRRRRRGRGGSGADERPRGASPERPRLPAPGNHYAPTRSEGLEALLVATASLLQRSDRPAFLGTGAFGGPWSTRQD
ncbi:MAG TPA: polynucleotide adenylyltransferase PcnB [Polyangia bacterium]|jgi:poly(A) polymerase|nr:polynucleotide adenylyltransferase PcnB [Polyangia bacterium]